jgi:ankyrin repeat protein
MGDLLRKLLNEFHDDHSIELCSAPSHGPMSLIAFGSDAHSHLLDHIFKIRHSSANKKISCRQCGRDTVSSDLRFFYCSQCHYIRCVYCKPLSSAPLVVIPTTTATSGPTILSSSLAMSSLSLSSSPPPSLLPSSSSSIPWHTVLLVIETFPHLLGKVYPGDRLVFHELAAQDPTGAIIQRCISLYKSGVYVTDQSGDLPLHWACMSGANTHNIHALLLAFPEGARLANQSGKLPLHLSCQYLDLEAIRLLLSLHSEACSVADSHGWLPLHYALNTSPTITSTVMPPSSPSLHLSLAIIELLLSTYPGSAQTPTHQGLFPLHLYLRNRPTPSPAVVKLLLHHFPFGAFVTVGQQDELPLHLVIARDPPPLEVIESLIEINPEGCLQPSTATSWCESETPMSIAIKRAVKGGDVHIIQDYLQNNQPVEIYWSV